MDNFFKAVNKGVSFALELAMIVGFCYGGFWASRVLWLKLVLGIGIPAAVIVFWALFLAPNSKRRFKMFPGITVSAALFLTSAAALSGSNQHLAAVILAFVAVANFMLKLAWKQW